MFVNPKARPFATNKHRPVVVHWEKDTTTGLDRDTDTGAIPPKELGEPNTWYTAMYVVAIKSDKPRKAVDCRKINHACLKQTKGQENHDNTTRSADTTHAVERADVQDQEGEQGGAANLRNTSHTTKTHSNILKSKELGDDDETKNMTKTAPNITDPKNVNNKHPILPIGDRSQASIAKTRKPGEQN